jgi:hypothetical protein
MDTGKLNFALKLIQEEYKLSSDQVTVLNRRLMADDKEFERLWKVYRSRQMGNADRFKEILSELLE